MRHAIGLGFVLLLVSPGEGRAAGSQLPPCRRISWASTGAMTTPRLQHAATLLPSGKVLVTGGTTEPVGRGLATAELYDPVTGTWTPTGSMSTGRWGHTMTVLPTGKVLVAGGFDSVADVATDTAELYDPDTGQWTTTGAMLEARYDHTATLLATGKVLVVGGVGRGFLASAELYDPTTGQWQATAALPAVRIDHTATRLASGQVLVLGGLSSDGRTASAELYDPAAGTWTPGHPMLTGRDLHTATLLPSNAVLVAGGFGQPPAPGFPSPVLTEAEISDRAPAAWRRTGSLFAPHSGHTATLLPSGRVLVVDGVASSPGPSIANTELFDPASETWIDAGCTTEARVAHTATLLPSGAVLVAGGTTSGTSSSGSATGTSEIYGVVVSPAQVTLATGASQTFTASGGSGLGYVWSFKQNNSSGTLTPSGDYQAGPIGAETDIVQVVDSFANSATATVIVTPQGSLVSATSPHASSSGCGTTDGAALPSLAGAVLLLLGWRVWRRGDGRIRH